MGGSLGSRGLGPFVLAILVTGCGGSSPTYVLGECIVPSDGYTSCDDYCAATFETTARDGVIFGADAAGHACEVGFGGPAVAASAAYSTLADCQSGADANTLVPQGTSSPFGAGSDMAAQCCCVQP